MPRCLVIMYHYVHDAARIALPCDLSLGRGVVGLTPAQFEQQLDELTGCLEPVDWPTLMRWSHGESNLPDDSFLLTFDDGLADHVRFVRPILERRGLSGTFFVATSTLDGANLLAAHAVHLLLAALGDEILPEELERTTRNRGFDLGTSAPLVQVRANYAYESETRARLKRRLHFEWPTSLRDAILADVFARHLGSAADWARGWYMSRDDLRGLESAGHTIGGHGHTHEPLARLSPVEQQIDLVRCWNELTKICGCRVRPFSYPFGSFTGETPAIARRAGFEQAFTTESRCLCSGDDDFRLPRIDTINVSQRLVEFKRCPQPF